MPLDDYSSIGQLIDKWQRLACLAELDTDNWSAIDSTHRDQFAEVLTAAEAVRFLRLDGPKGPRDPYQVLYRYRKQCLLKGVQIGREIAYTKEELMNFLRRKTEGNR